MSSQDKDVGLSFIQAMGAGDPVAAASCLDPEAYTLAKGYGQCSRRRAMNFDESLRHNRRAEDLSDFFNSIGEREPLLGARCDRRQWSG